MGVCASCLDSCLGTRRKDDPARSHLLPPPSQSTAYPYGTYPPSPTAQHPPLLDPQQALHEREYLDRIVAQTSENLIDIFAPPMLTGAPGSMSVTPSSRGEWYKGLLERVELGGGIGVEKPVVGDPKEVGPDERRWLEHLVEVGEDAVREVARVREVGALVVGLEMDM